MPDVATEPVPPPPPPILTRESFAALNAMLEQLEQVTEYLEPSLSIPLPTACDNVVRVVGKMFVTFDQKVQAGGVNAETLQAWAARAGMLGACCLSVMSNALVKLAELGAPAAATDQTPVALQPPAPPRRAEEVAQLPDHLAARVRPMRGIPSPGSPLVAIENGSGLVRIECTECGVALGEVGRDVAEDVARTHLRERHSPLAVRPDVARIVTAEDAVTMLGKGSVMAAEALEWLHPTVPDPGPGPYDQPTCRRCYCTEANACVRAVDSSDGSPQTCSWNELNPETNAGVCSACAE